jgi:hypothetical protein
LSKPGSKNHEPSTFLVRHILAKISLFDSFLIYRDPIVLNLIFTIGNILIDHYPFPF